MVFVLAFIICDSVRSKNDALEKDLKDMKIKN